MENGGPGLLLSPPGPEETSPGSAGSPASPIESPAGSIGIAAGPTDSAAGPIGITAGTVGSAAGSVGCAPGLSGSAPGPVVSLLSESDNGEYEGKLLADLTEPPLCGYALAVVEKDEEKESIKWGSRKIVTAKLRMPFRTPEEHLRRVRDLKMGV